MNMKMKLVIPVLAMAVLTALAACGSSSLLATNNEEEVREKVIAVASGSITLPMYKWPDEYEYSRATPNFYSDPPDATTTARPAHIKDVVVHETLSAEVGFRMTYIIDSFSGRSMGMGTLYSETTTESPLVAPSEYQLNSNEDFHITSSDKFAPYLMLRSSNPIEMYYLLTVLVDYEQVEFTLDGKTGLLHEVRMPRGMELMMPFNIGPLPAGQHDVEIVIFAEPYEGYDLEIDGPSNETPNFADLRLHEMIERKIVIVDGDTRPARQLKARYTGTVPTHDYRIGYIAFFAKPGDAHPYEPGSQFVTDAGTAGSEYRFRTLTFRPETFNDGSQAIMMFIDYHLVPVNGEDMMVVQLNSGQEVIIDTSVTLPTAPGIHQIFALVAINPFGDETVNRRDLRSIASNTKLAIKTE